MSGSQSLLGANNPMAMFQGLQQHMGGMPQGGMGGMPPQPMTGGFSLGPWFNMSPDQMAMFQPQKQQQIPSLFDMGGMQQQGQFNPASLHPNNGLNYEFQALMRQVMGYPGVGQQGQHPQMPQQIQPLLPQQPSLIPQQVAPTINPMAFQPMQPAMPQPAAQPVQAAPQPAQQQPMASPTQEAIDAAMAAAQEQARRELADRVSYMGGGSEGNG